MAEKKKGKKSGKKKSDEKKKQDEPKKAKAEEESEEAEAPPTLSEEELRERLEEEIRNLRVQDVLVQSIVSILNLSARRIAKDDERDLEQGRAGIEAVRALVPLLDEEASASVRQALSELQVLYARHAGEPASD